MLIPLQTTLVLSPSIRMKTLLFLLFLTALLPAQKPPAARKPAAAADGWLLTFADEFDARELDLSKWIPHDPGAKTPTPETVSLSDGLLHIPGTISTFGLFAQMYGRFEMRFRGATGSELILQPVPSGILPRIEIFRMTAADAVALGNWWGSEQTERSYSDTFGVSGLSRGFHTVVLEWTRERIAWSIDGKKTFESGDGVPHQPMYLVIRGVPDVDYVRVYQSPRPQGSQ